MNNLMNLKSPKKSLFNRFAHSAGPGIAPAAWEKGPQRVEKSTRPGSQKEPPASHKKLSIFRILDGFSALFMAPTACESGSQEVEVSDARGSKNRSSGGQIWSNFAPRGSQTGFLSPPGASSAPGRPQEGALGGKGGGGKLY